MMEQIKEVKDYKNIFLLKKKRRLLIHFSSNQRARGVTHLKFQISDQFMYI